MLSRIPKRVVSLHRSHWFFLLSLDIHLLWMADLQVSGDNANEDSIKEIEERGYLIQTKNESKRPTNHTTPHDQFSVVFSFNAPFSHDFHLECRTWVARPNQERESRRIISSEGSLLATFRLQC